VDDSVAAANHDARVSEEDRASIARRAATAARVAGFTYGTIVVLSVIVAGAKGYPDASGRIAALVGATAVVFWLAHVYAHGLGHSVAHDRRLSLAELRHIARREASIVEAAVPPVGALLLGAFGVLSTQASVWAAIGLGLGVLVVQGIRYARVERLETLATLLVVAVNVGLGLVLIGLKLFVVH
jgi:hypothetical protein